MIEAINRIKAVADTLPDDDPDKLEMLNIEGDYNALIDWALTRYQEHKFSEKNAKALAARYTERAKSFEKAKERTKGIIEWIMGSAQETAYKSYVGTVSTRTNPAKPRVIDEDLLPDEFFTRTLSKSKLNAAIKDGEQFEGVVMDNGSTSLNIR